ncbi:SusC/RagA family TonB-linked outer membrane protein [Fulvitalea axinellae]|uniref:SusC/RagA family TonB-linked outer membrane protein n=1 Tax=Fulvitalea axinellae TaxID=1182444 RepID=A0AAU9CQ23_9BACT|nr:SusC/RagA family TonB-linked outer membrane protein [Fulvitalea axinellae]
MFVFLSEQKRAIIPWLLGVFCLLLVNASAFAQDIMVKGKVVDAESKEGLIGVAVAVKGTALGTVTDIEGQFSIKVPSSSAILQFSAIGYAATEENVGNRTFVEVAMTEDVQELEEVVVTAFGLKKEKKRLGYSVTELKGSSISDVQVVNPVDGLQGKVAGVQITQGAGGSFGGSRITIRGNSTLGSNTQPLFVVDGIIMESSTSGGDMWGTSDWGNDLKNLNPDEFESVTVLKGAAAAALYGSRALEGVVIITSKKGKARKGIGVNVSHSSGISQVYDGPDFQNTYGGGFIAGYSGHDDPFDTRQFMTNSDGEPIRDTGASSWGPRMEGQKIREYDGSWGTYSAQPDNFKELYETGRSHNTSVALSGGNEKTTYRAGYSNMIQKGVDPGNNFDRNSLQLSLGRQITDRLRLDVLTNYTKSVAENPPLRKVQRSFIYDYFPRDYDPNKWKDDYKAPHGGLPDTNNGDVSKGPGTSVYWQLYEENRERTEEILRLKAGLTYQINDWLTWTGEGYIDNKYTTYEEKKLGSKINNAGGNYKVENRRREQTFAKTMLTFNKDLNQDWNVAFSVGGESWETKGRWSVSETNGGLIVPGNYTISNSKDKAKTNGGQEENRKFISAYYFGDVAWRNTLFLNFTGRNDWNSTMAYPDNTGNFSFFYPSVSLSWAFTESIEMPSFFTFGKVRASYAEVGNGTRAYLLSDGYKRTDETKYEGTTPAYSYKSNRVFAEDFKPERSKAIEFGADLRFFENRLGVDFTWFKKNTYDQILSLGVPSYSGVSSMMFNAGNIENKGIEIAVNATPLILGDFKWEVNFNYTSLQNKIIELDDDLGITEKSLSGNATYGDRIGTYAIVGGNYGDMMTDAAYKYDDNGNVIVKWHGGAKSPYAARNGERTTVGNIMSDWYGGVTNTFSYKGLSMRVFLDVKMGGDIYSFTQRYGQMNGLFKSSLSYRDAEQGGITWTSSNGKTYEDGYIPKGMVFEAETTINGVNVGGMTVEEAYEKGHIEPIHVSSFNYFLGSWSRGIVEEYVNEASYVALREIVLSYRFPRSITDKLRLNNLNVSLYGRNLGFLYNSLPDNINPEANASNNASDAFEYGATPYVRNYGFKVSFGL